MNTRILSLPLSLALAATAAAQSTAFTYQGRLKNGAQLAAGPHDLRFRLFDSALGGTQLGTTQCADNVSVTEGLFTVPLDFGQQYATTAPRFLEIEVRADTGLDCANATGFIPLSPRQLLTAAPMASHAKAAFALDAADGSPANAVFVDNTGHVGIGTTTPQANIHVMASGQGVRLQGQSVGVDNSCYMGFANGAGTDLGYLGDGSSGDNNMYLTCYTGDVYLYTAAGAAVAAKPSGNVGIGTPTPTAKLDVRGDIRLGPSGQLLATSAGENLRMIRGDIDGTGLILSGSGFSCSRILEGTYEIQYSAPFTAAPSVLATASNVVGQSRRFAENCSECTNLPGRTIIRISNDSGAFINSKFSFIAVGPR